MLRFLAALGLASLVGVSEGHDFAEGQVWNYHTRPGETNSTLQINKIEHDSKLGAIFHISVFDVRIKNPHLASGITTDLPHFPVSRETLDKSVVSLSKAPARRVDYQDGYVEWKRAFDAGHAGIFTITAADIVGTVEQTIAKKDQ